METGPVVRTDRLVLRRLAPADAGPIAGYRSLPDVARYQSWEAFSPADAARLVAAQQGVVPNTPGTWLQLAITKDGGVVGDCGLHFLDDRQAEVGVTLAGAHQGRGYAAEALRAVLDYLFGTLGKHRVVATTDARNRPAAALFERLGFRREAHFVRNVWFKGEWGDEFLFARLAEEWARDRAR
ncbi:MAG: GNAT family protein [Gemmataceae bacterium]